MEKASSLNDIENAIYLNKICKLAGDLASVTDTLLFVKQMTSLSSVLSSFEQYLDNNNNTTSFSFIDENANDPTYFIAAYFDTKKIDTALLIYKIVRSLTRYILLLDRFYETGDDNYVLLARQLLESLNKFLVSQSDSAYLTYHIEYLLGQFSPFWKLEQIIKRRMLENYAFSYREIRQFILSKSSDASLIYAKVLDAKLPSFNENVALVLHYNQALLDIYDDCDDIEEDVIQCMPNIFVMAALDNISFDRVRKSKDNRLREVVLNGNGSTQSCINRLVNDIQAATKSISIPDCFGFLKALSECYADSIRGKLTPANY